MCVVVSVALRLIDVPHGCCICPPGCNPISLREAFWLPYDDGATEITQNSSAIFLPDNAARPAIATMRHCGFTSKHGMLSVATT